MIALLEGELAVKQPDQVIIKTGGVGYQVFIPLSTFYSLPEPPARVSLSIHTHVQTDNLQLFGFSTAAERETFQKLITIPRIGPRLALNILSGITPQELANALVHQDVRRLAAIPGIGKKSAERLLMELKDKLPAVAGAAAPIPGPAADMWQDAVSALMNLGYSRTQAEQAVQTVQTQGEAHSLEEILRRSLGKLAG